MPRRSAGGACTCGASSVDRVRLPAVPLFLTLSRSPFDRETRVRYTADDVGAIVAEAARRQHQHDDTFTIDDISGIAGEFGIRPEYVAEAVESREASQRRSAKHERERRSFRTHATIYALVIGSMWIAALIGGAIAIATGVWGAIPFWVVFPTFGWGIGLWSHWQKVRSLELEATGLSPMTAPVRT